MPLDSTAQSQRTKKENTAGLKAVRKLRGDLRREVNSAVKRGATGKMAAISATKRMRDGSLRGITIKAPKHAYIHHYGFIGTKINGVFQRLEQTNFINEAIAQGSIDTLATEISEIRAEEIVANITVNR